MLAAVLIPLGLTAGWVETTVFDADALSRRAVRALDSPAVRHEVALQLTEQLVRKGDRNVIAFRPAAVVAAEAVIDTDAFRSIFATAIRRTHASLLEGDGGAGLDLSDSLGLVASGLQLDSVVAANPGDSADGSSFGDVVQRVADLPIWNLSTAMTELALGALLFGAIGAVASVLVSADRRLGLVRVGLAVAAGAALTAALVAVAALVSSRFADDADLASAFEGVAWFVTSDLRTAMLGVMAVGLVAAAAAAPRDRFDPRVIAAAARNRVVSWRSTTKGTLGLAAATAIAGIVVLMEPDGVLTLVLHSAGLGLVFIGARMVVSLLPDLDSGASSSPVPRHHRVLSTVVVVALLLGTGAVAVVATQRARDASAASVPSTCQGSVTLCDRRLDEITLPGAHNAMSSVEYPGWLFGEQIAPIGTQLRNGVRALLLDTHYGRPSSVEVPGSSAPLIITDVAAELTVPGAELGNPELQARADELSALADTTGERHVYLCHNHCELGAVLLVDELRAVHQFLDENPDQVVMMIIQDATSSADVVAAFDESGLTSEVVTLTPGAPLPTLGELVDAGTQLVVFAERGDDQAPAWYHRAYDWFQETTFTYDSVASFDCEPNRGGDANPLFLINHWVSVSPPNPATARAANARAVLEDRVGRCVAERGVLPNVIAVDFAGLGDVVDVAADLSTNPR